MRKDRHLKTPHRLKLESERKRVWRLNPLNVQKERNYAKTKEAKYKEKIRRIKFSEKRSGI